MKLDLRYISGSDAAGVVTEVGSEVTSVVETYAVTGSFDTIARRIQERYAGLLDRASLYQPWQPGLTDPRWPALVKQFNG